MYMTAVLPATAIPVTKQTVVIRDTAKLRQAMNTDLAARSAARVPTMQQQVVRLARSVRPERHLTQKARQRHLLVRLVEPEHIRPAMVKAVARPVVRERIIPQPVIQDVQPAKPDITARAAAAERNVQPEHTARQRAAKRQPIVQPVKPVITVLAVAAERNVQPEHTARQRVVRRQLIALLAKPDITVLAAAGRNAQPERIAQARVTQAVQPAKPDITARAAQIIRNVQPEHTARQRAAKRQPIVQPAMPVNIRPPEQVLAQPVRTSRVHRSIVTAAERRHVHRPVMRQPVRGQPEAGGIVQRMSAEPDSTVPILRPAVVQAAELIHINQVHLTTTRLVRLAAAVSGLM